MDKPDFDYLAQKAGRNKDSIAKAIESAWKLGKKQETDRIIQILDKVSPCECEYCDECKLIKKIKEEYF